MSEKYALECTDCQDPVISKFAPVDGGPIFCRDCAKRHGMPKSLDAGTAQALQGKYYKAKCMRCNQEFIFPITVPQFLSMSSICCTNCNRDSMI